MSLKYAVVQKRLKMLDSVSTAPAYVNALGLSALDARNQIGITPCGILRENLDHGQAIAMQNELFTVNVESVVLKMEDINTTKPLREIINLGGVTARWFNYETGRGVIGSVPWDAFLVVSVAGNILSAGHTKQEFEYYLDIYSKAALKHIRINYKKFSYSYLGDRLTAKPEQNFSYLVEDICKNCGKKCFVDPNTRFVIEQKYKMVPTHKDLRIWDIENRWRLLMATNRILIQPESLDKVSNTVILDRNKILPELNQYFPALVPFDWDKQQENYTQKIIDELTSPLIALAKQGRKSLKLDYLEKSVEDNTQEICEEAMLNLATRSNAIKWECEEFERDGNTFQLLTHEIDEISSSDIFNPDLWYEAHKLIKCDDTISFAIPTRNCLIASNDIVRLINICNAKYVRQGPKVTFPISSAIYFVTNGKIGGIQVNEPIFVKNDSKTAALFSIFGHTIEATIEAMEEQYKNYVNAICANPKFEGTVIFEIDTTHLPAEVENAFPISYITSKLNQLTDERLLSTVDGNPIEVICRFVETDILDEQKNEDDGWRFFQNCLSKVLQKNRPKTSLYEIGETLVDLDNSTPVIIDLDGDMEISTPSVDCVSKTVQSKFDKKPKTEKLPKIKKTKTNISKINIGSTTNETKDGDNERTNDPPPSNNKNEEITVNPKQYRPLAVDITLNALVEGKMRAEILKRLTKNSISDDEAEVIIDTVQLVFQKLSRKLT